jgi:hypothetical protein
MPHRKGINGMAKVRLLVLDLFDKGFGCFNRRGIPGPPNKSGVLDPKLNVGLASRDGVSFAHKPTGYHKLKGLKKYSFFGELGGLLIFLVLQIRLGFIYR